MGFESGRDGFGIVRALQSGGSKSMSCTPSASPWSGVASAPRPTASTWIFFDDADRLAARRTGALHDPPIPSEEEEDLREPGRRRETLVKTRLKVENQIASLLIRQGIASFKPRLKNCETKLGELRTFDGISEALLFLLYLTL